MFFLVCFLYMYILHIQFLFGAGWRSYWVNVAKHIFCAPLSGSRDCNFLYRRWEKGPSCLTYRGRQIKWNLVSFLHAGTTLNQIHCTHKVSNSWTKYWSGILDVPLRVYYHLCCKEGIFFFFFWVRFNGVLIFRDVLCIWPFALFSLLFLLLHLHITSRLTYKR